MAKLRELSTGAFADRAVNVLAFGTPGVGKSHGMSALGHALVERGYSVLWSPAFQVVQQLLAAKRDLRLPQALKRFDAFDVMILDSCGVPRYVERLRRPRLICGARVDAGFT
jgi:DNA replication protein DnaC